MIEDQNKEISIYDELNTLRLILLIEKEPFKNEYEQIYLTPNQFNKVSEAIAKVFTKEDGTFDGLIVGESTFKLPVEIQQIHICDKHHD